MKRKAKSNNANTKKETRAEQIILPKNSGLRDAYLAILKLVYSEGKDAFWFHELVGAVTYECGVGEEVSMGRLKQMSKFGLIKYLDSSLSGHIYRIEMFLSYDTGQITQVDGVSEKLRIIESQVPDLVETELVRIKRSMNNQVKTRLGDLTSIATIAEDDSCLHTGMDDKQVLSGERTARDAAELGLRDHADTVRPEILEANILYPAADSRQEGTIQSDKTVGSGVNDLSEINLNPRNLFYGEGKERWLRKLDRVRFITSTKEDTIKSSFKTLDKKPTQELVKELQKSLDVSKESPDVEQANVEGRSG